MSYKMHHQESTRLSLFLLLVFSLFLSFYFGENSSGGSRLDNQITRPFIDNFNQGIFEGFNYFISSNQVQSPFFYIFVSSLEKVFGIFFTKFSYILISSFIPLIFYTSLKKKFRNTNRNYLFFFSLLIFLSPYFRSSSVWMTTDNFALLFFILSVSKFLCLKKGSSTKEIIVCLIYLSIATYIRQYYIVFFIFYFVKLFKIYNLKKNFKLIIYLTAIFVPYFIYYYFVLIQYLSNYELNNNQDSIFKFSVISNILVFLSLYFFYTIPFYFNVFKTFKKIFTIRKLLICISALIVFVFIVFFNPINFNEFGGGIFFKISKIFNNNLLFYFSAYFGFLLLLLNLNLNNFIIYLCIAFSFPVAIIYQKYFDPLLILSLTTITIGGQLNKIIGENKINLIILFLYFGLFLLGSNFYYSQ
tara:strand:- start:3053 stop:4297 length:1245 start_codon:yes stop_codon:yes gene_type:complete